MHVVYDPDSESWPSFFQQQKPSHEGTPMRVNQRGAGLVGAGLGAVLLPYARYLIPIAQGAVPLLVRKALSITPCMRRSKTKNKESDEPAYQQSVKVSSKKASKTKDKIRTKTIVRGLASLASDAVQNALPARPTPPTTAKTHLLIGKRLRKAAPFLSSALPQIVSRKRRSLPADPFNSSL